MEFRKACGCQPDPAVFGHKSWCRTGYRPRLIQPSDEPWLRSELEPPAPTYVSGLDPEQVQAVLDRIGDRLGEMTSPRLELPSLPRLELPLETRLALARADEELRERCRQIARHTTWGAVINEPLPLCLISGV